MRLSTRVAIVIGASLLAFTDAAQGQNRVENGDFDTSLAGWYWAPSFVEDSWSPMDAGASPASGSARQENSNDDGIKAGGIGQCVPATAGESYQVGGSVYVPSGQSADGLAGIHWQWKASLDCSGASIGGLLGTDGEAAGFDEWYHWHSDFVSAPVGTQSILLDLISRKNDATGTFVAYWDDIFVIPEPAAALLQGAALGALAALGRRRRAQR